MANSTISAPRSKRLGMRLDSGDRLFDVHMFEVGSSQIERHLVFRDYLLAHPTQSKEHEAEKVRAAVQDPTDVLAYNSAKSAWIRACELRALAWIKQR